MRTIKIFCDVCEKELTPEEVAYCNEMVGYGDFCRDHFPKYDIVYVKKDRETMSKTDWSKSIKLWVSNWK